MPVEIRELNIRIQVNEPEKTAQTPANQSATAQQTTTAADALLKECVEQTLQIIHEKHER